MVHFNGSSPEFDKWINALLLDPESSAPAPSTAPADSVAPLVRQPYERFFPFSSYPSRDGLCRQQAGNKTFPREGDGLARGADEVPAGLSSGDARIFQQLYGILAGLVNASISGADLNPQGLLYGNDLYMRAIKDDLRTGITNQGIPLGRMSPQSGSVSNAAHSDQAVIIFSWGIERMTFGPVDLLAKEVQPSGTLTGDDIGVIYASESAVDLSQVYIHTAIKKSSKPGLVVLIRLRSYGLDG